MHFLHEEPSKEKLGYDLYLAFRYETYLIGSNKYNDEFSFPFSMNNWSDQRKRKGIRLVLWLEHKEIREWMWYPFESWEGESTTGSVVGMPLVIKTWIN
jgi:hypothetical protein